MTTYGGVYRGKVENDLDPMMKGRVQLSVAAIGEGRLNWAEVARPTAGDGVGFWVVPPVGSTVWVMFEAGDPEKPVVVGSSWVGTSTPPASPAVPQVSMWKTESVSLTLSDLPGVGGLTIEVGPPVTQVPIKLVMGATGVELSMGAAKIELSATKVTVNGGALEVM
jgi:phage baseplate assembly protein gpV